MPGTLYIVATPIGNLEDMTFRGVRVLREVQIIAAEDTRRTAKLLTHFAIHTPTISLHDHNEGQRMPMLLSRLGHGDSVALVSDAGTPAVSDPGSRFIAAAIEAGLRVEPVPGASAVLGALVASGFAIDQFSFVGFPPSNAAQRGSWLASIAEEPRPIVFFEAPHRIEATLTAALEVWGDRPIAVARELTKVHEQHVRGPISEVLRQIRGAKGEMTVVVAPRPDETRDGASRPEAGQVWTEFCRLTEEGGMPRREAIRRLARRYELPGREIYAAIETGRGLAASPSGAKT